jgi:hypothetical protein
MARSAAKLPAGANESVFLPRWREISGLPTTHRTWYGETQGVAPGVREIEGSPRKLRAILGNIWDAGRSRRKRGRNSDMR